MFTIVPFLIILISACSPTPKSIEYGYDNCHYCKMIIVDRQHAAEVVTDKGKVFKFDAIECMVHYLSDEQGTEHAHLLVNDYEQPTVLIDALTSQYLISKAIPSPMGAYLSAFVNKETADKMQAEKGGDVYSWAQLNQTLLQSMK